MLADGPMIETWRPHPWWLQRVACLFCCWAAGGCGGEAIENRGGLSSEELSELNLPPGPVSADADDTGIHPDCPSIEFTIDEVAVRSDSFHNDGGGVEIRDFSVAQDLCGNAYFSWSARGEIELVRSNANGAHSWSQTILPTTAEGPPESLGAVVGVATEDSGAGILAANSAIWRAGPDGQLSRLTESGDTHRDRYHSFASRLSNGTGVGGPGLAFVPDGGSTVRTLNAERGTDNFHQHEGVALSASSYLDATLMDYSAPRYVIEKVTIGGGGIESRESVAELSLLSSQFGETSLVMAASGSLIGALVRSSRFVEGERECQTVLLQPGTELEVELPGCPLPQDIAFTSESDLVAVLLDLPEPNNQARLSVVRWRAATGELEQMNQIELSAGELQFVDRDLQIARFMAIPEPRVAFLDPSTSAIRFLELNSVSID